MAVIKLGMTDGGGASINEMAQRTYTRCYLLKTTTLGDADDENAVIAECGVRLYQSHPTYGNAFCTGIDVDIIDRICNDDGETSGLLWKASIKYGPLSADVREMMVDSGGGVYTFNPLNRKPRFRFAGENSEIPAWKTWDNKPILNSVGDFFDPGLTRQKFRGTLSVRVNQDTVNWWGMFGYSNKVNSDTWNGFPPKTVLVLPISMPEKEYNQETGEDYFPMEYNFAIAPDTWTRKIANAGLRQLNAPNGTQRIPILVDGVQATSPVLLKADGTVLNPPVADNAIVFRDFDIEEPISFYNAFGEKLANLFTS